MLEHCEGGLFHSVDSTKKDFLCMVLKQKAGLQNIVCHRNLKEPSGLPSTGVV